MGANIGWLFYKDYYNKINLDDIDYKTKTKGITNKKLVHYKNIPNYENVTNIKPLILRTTYPGLLLGSGYQHDFSDKEAFKIGFYFDYSTGLPVIPGSSIKGVLRNVFPFHNKDFGDDFQDNRTEYIIDLLKGIGINISTVNKDTIKKLELEIFENGIIVQEKTDSTKEIIKHDVFYDAYPVKTYNNQGKFLAEDYITPHKNPLKAPNPIKFLKVLPEVEFHFYFKLNNSKIIPDLTAEKKLDLFKAIILDMGIGAKTNVGYGQFKFVAEMLEENITETHRRELTHDRTNNEKNKYQTTVVAINEEYILFQFNRDDLNDCRISKRIQTVNNKFDKDLEKKQKRKPNIEYKELSVGDNVTIRINEQKDDNVLNFTVLPIWIENE